MARRADEVERRRLNDLFVELCGIESPSGREAPCSARVRAELYGLGLAVESDGAGNVFARIAGASDTALMLCAHLDTVALQAPVEPVLVENGWENANEGILGADNKAAVAMLLALAHRCAAEPPPIGLELLFTVSEEVGLVGAQAFDAGRLRSAFGYVFDHATPIGEIVLAGPTYYRLEAAFHGAAAHAGIRPEQGRSAIAAAAQAVAAMRLGRLDEETTANVGQIEGGTARNVVPEHCRFTAEARSHDERKLADVIEEMLETVTFAAGVAECEVETQLGASARGYRFRRDDVPVRLAAAALERGGREPSYILSGGGADANVFNERGLQCLNLANGMADIHTPDERIALADLDLMVDVTLALVEAARDAA